ncbi:KR domain-containing protein [Xylaria grammica]|nr:KR domain-containing protein [Xylaria grammica]
MFIETHPSVVSVINPATVAYRALVDLARIEKGEKVLIHLAAGSTGQMAILMANWVGAEVFATVGYDDKKDFLVREFYAAGDHIFYSCGLSFAKGVMRMTHGRGVDVILNSLSGQALQSTWECMAPYGRFVEIGKTDMQTNTLLPMGQPRKNVSFFALDVQHISQTDLDLTQRLLTSVVDMLTSGIVKPPLPTRVFPPQRVKEAFRTVQSGKHTGRVMVTIEQGNVTKFTRGVSYWRLDANASYVIAGGFGGLGRCIIRWLAKKGARHLIVLSRSGTSSSPMAAELVSWLKQQGVRVAAPRCDLCSPPTIEAVLAACGGTMPPVKGYINSANILQDAIFENLTYEQWDFTVRTKRMSSWALHALLPADLDFFVLLSSVSSLYGIPSQSNYAASCTYQDALARYRVAHGRKATSFDMGWMQAVGIVAETDRYIQTPRAMAHVDPISEDALLALLDVYCDPPTRDLLRPVFSAFLWPAGSGAGPAAASDAPAGEDESAQFQRAKTAADRFGIVLRALVGKVARLLCVSADGIDEEKHLSEYGVDSLVAAGVATFEIMGGKSIASLASSVVERSQWAMDSRDVSEG